MRGARKSLLAAVVAVSLAAGIVACGDADSTSESVATTASGQGEGSAAFRVPGGDNSIQNFGSEATAAEAAAAAAALTAYMRARARDEWEAQCAHLAKVAIEPIEGLAAKSPQFKDKGCPAILAAFVAGTPAAARASTLTGGLGSLRVEGDQGFALYHGPKGVDYVMPMTREDGEWRVGSLAPSELN